MISRRKTAFLVGAFAFITCSHTFPSSLDAENNRKPKQDDDDAPTSSINFGQQVAQIIAGAFTGNIDSIIKGSLGFIEDPTVNVVSHNTWETLKGNPTKTPPWISTTEAVERETVPPAPSQPKAPQPPPPPPPTPAASVVQPPPPVLQAAAPSAPIVETAPAPAQSQPAPASIYTPDVYYPGSPFYPTSPPVRTTQPTYATLAPLSVIEGTGQTEREPDEPSTPRTTTEEDDDGDEAEGLSAEVGDNFFQGRRNQKMGKEARQQLALALPKKE